MSMYSQPAYPSTSYGQHSGYASTSRAPQPTYYGGYSSPPPQAAPYQSPPPSRQDIQIFRDWFTQQLSALVENNRAVIHRLAYIAREHVERFAPVISECLEVHIHRVSNLSVILSYSLSVPVARSYLSYHVQVVTAPLTCRMSLPACAYVSMIRCCKAT